MFTYDRMPTQTQDPYLVADPPEFTFLGSPSSSQLSVFGKVDGVKRSAYCVTNTNGDDAPRWALDEVARFPDGDYLLTVTAWSIAQANGVGTAPTLQEAELARIVSVATAGDLRRLTLSNP